MTKPMEINKNIAISDSGFVFNPASGESFSVNQSGTELLLMIKSGKSNDEIRQFFLDKYDTLSTTFDRDFQDFVEMLSQYHLTDNQQEK
jgi:urate oxidase